MSTNKGVKLDEGKLLWELLPIKEVEEIVRVLTYGAQKYTRDGWQTVPNGIERYYAALLRHLVAWRQGEQMDEESGLPHLSHVLTNAVFLSYLSRQGV